MSNLKEEPRCPEIEHLAAQIGDFIEYWGFKKIHGRIWLYLFISENPLDAGALIRKLKVSKALMSLSLKQLLDYEVILEVGKSDKATTLYKANPDIIKVITNVLRSREKIMFSNIRASCRLVSELDKDDQQRCGLSQDKINQLQQFVRQGECGLDAIIALKSFDLSSWKNLCFKD